MAKYLFSLQEQEWRAFTDSFTSILHLFLFKRLIYSNISTVRLVFFGILAFHHRTYTSDMEIAVNFLFPDDYVPGDNG